MRQFINSTDFNITGDLHLNVDTIQKNLSRRNQEPRISKLSTHSIRLFIAKETRALARRFVHVCAWLVPLFGYLILI